MFWCVFHQIITHCFLTVCKIYVDVLRDCWKKTAKLTKRLMINNGDNDGCCLCGDSRVISGCRELTGRGWVETKNRVRRWSHASLARTWKQIRSADGYLFGPHCNQEPLLYVSYLQTKINGWVGVKWSTQPCVDWIHNHSVPNHRGQRWQEADKEETDETQTSWPDTCWKNQYYITHFTLANLPSLFPHHCLILSLSDSVH